MSSARPRSIVGGREAAKVADRLKSAKVPVVLRLNFPEEPRVPTEAEYRKKPAAERDEPLRVLAHRKAKWKEQVGDGGRPGQGGRSVRLRHRGNRTDRLVSRRSSASSSPRDWPPDDALAGLTKNAAAIAGRRPPAGHPRAGQARPRDRPDGPVHRRESQGQVRLDRRPEIRDQARGPGPDEVAGGRRPDGLALGGEPGDRPRFGGRGAGGRGFEPDDDEAPGRPRRKATPDRPDQKAKQRAGKGVADDKDPAPPSGADAEASAGNDRTPRRRSSPKPRRESEKAAKAADPRPRFRSPENENRSPQVRDRQDRAAKAAAAAVRRRGRPSSTTTASRRSTPAATFSSRGRRS